MRKERDSISLRVISDTNFNVEDCQKRWKNEFVTIICSIRNYICLPFTVTLYIVCDIHSFLNKDIWPNGFFQLNMSDWSCSNCLKHFPINICGITNLQCGQYSHVYTRGWSHFLQPTAALPYTQQGKPVATSMANVQRKLIIISREAVSNNSINHILNKQIKLSFHKKL